MIGDVAEGGHHFQLRGERKMHHSYRIEENQKKSSKNRSGLCGKCLHGNSCIISGYVLQSDMENSEEEGKTI